MFSFCPDPFWDWDLTWNLNNRSLAADYYGPDFTICFQQTALAWFPCLLLWLAAPFENGAQNRQQNRISLARPSFQRGHGVSYCVPTPWTLLGLVKSINIACLVILQGILLLSEITNNEGPQYLVRVITPLIWIISFCLAFCLQRKTKLKGKPSSGIQFIFWALMTFGGIFRFRRTLLKYLHERDDNRHEIFGQGVEMISFVLLVCQFLLNFKADNPSSKYIFGSTKIGPPGASSFHENPNPENRASFISRILFLWVEPILHKGYKKPLEFDDLWKLNEEDKCEHHIDQFYALWDAGEVRRTSASGTKERPSLLRTLIRIFGPSFCVGALLKLFQDCLLFAAPQILRLLVTFIEHPEEPWKGILYASLLFTTSILQTIFLESTVGEIVNLMSVDANHFMELIPFLNLLWSAPFQVTMCLYFLYQVLGWSVLAGLAVLIVLTPVSIILSSHMKTLQIKQMESKDHRVKLMNEIISGIKVLKLYAWESSFKKEINKIRDKEMQVLKSTAWIDAFVSLVSNASPFLVALASCGTYVMVDKDHIFDATKAFVSLTLFNIMRVPLSMLTSVISNVVKAQVSLGRLNHFLNTPEIDPLGITHFENIEYPITIEYATFSWDEDTTALRDINLNIKRGELVVIVGPVGSGKSSLLAAILGELSHSLGTVNTKGSIAYVSQHAWIQSGTVEENILFGDSKCVVKYRRVLEACALLPDLATLPNGERTQIGENGINLSGGQKQRVALARAAYKNTDIYLLDDPFSALDSTVGKHIFEELVKGDILAGKTRVLVTHNLSHLTQVDRIIVLTDGQISEVGTYEELVNLKGNFFEFLSVHDTANVNGTQSITLEEEEPIGDPLFLNDPPNIYNAVNANDHAPAVEFRRGSKYYRRSQKSGTDSISDKIENEQENNLVSSDTSMISTEFTEIGSVKKGVYVHYVKSIGFSLVLLTLTLQLVSQTFGILTNIWLAEWSSQKITNGSQHFSERGMYLRIYASLGLSQVLFLTLGCISMAVGMSEASNVLHSQMLTRVLHAPMSFFESTPTGRLVNRFGKDVDTVDSILPINFRDLLFCLLNVLSTLLVICYSIPLFLIVILPLGFIYYIVQRYYVATSRQLKRIESVSRSPIYTHFSETLSGLNTIRAFGRQERFTSDFEAKVDFNNSANFPSIIANRWLSLRLETIANTIIFFASLFAVLGADQVSSGLVGLSISYALQVTNSLNWLVRMTAALETNIVAVERIKEYSEMGQESEYENGEIKPNEMWPEKGEIIFEAYQTSYRAGLKPALDNLSFAIQSGEKIGIVGRTGSGKSSVALGLFRIIEPTSGSIHIDGQNVTKFGLFDLRSRLTIIPQDPVLFSGSLRLNLDPFSAHDDVAIWEVLELANIRHFAKGLEGGLDYEILEGGENLSVGQRQQLCLARALLRKTKILILDEATASVDLETDNFIQETIRREFVNATVLTIAHRLKTIMDSNRVMVLDNGQIREFDTPSTLLSNKDSLFYAMAKDAGLV